MRVLSLVTACLIAAQSAASSVPASSGAAFAAAPPSAAEASPPPATTLSPPPSPPPQQTQQQQQSVMFVVKRDGRREPVSFDKITKRIANLCHGLNSLFIDPVVVAQDVVRGLYAGVTTSELDNLAAETAAYMSLVHPDYARLASRIAVSNLQKDTVAHFSEAMGVLHRYVDPKSELPAGFIDDKLYARIVKLAVRIDARIDHSRDFTFDFFGFKTMEKSYLLKIGSRVVERPQYMFMRVALGIHMAEVDDEAFLAAAFETYDLMSDKWFIHASPTLFHAGTRTPQMSSCFLLGMQADSIEGIYGTLTQCALISKAAGGIGLSISNIRAKGSYIKGTKGTSNGLVPMLRVFDTTARYVDQGGGKRPGAFAVYLEPWHADIFECLDLRKNTGKEETRARDLFYGLWVPDLFMRRVEEDGDWSLMCPAECPGLADCWGEEFDTLYASYERRGKARTTLKARELWYAILDAQMETGTPYMLYKDACNRKSNQRNLGTIKCSNLCTEIIEYTSNDEVAVCNLASIVLPKFVVASGSTAAAAATANGDDVPAPSPCSDTYGPGQHRFDHGRLREVTKVVTRNLNKIIDGNYYPIQEAANSNLRHRPIGIGVQGLADAFQLMGLPFDSDEARRLNRDVFETIYFAALEASCELAERVGTPYASYAGSPASEGLLQPDLWGVAPSERWDWPGLRARIARHGLHNSLLIAPMPTASTAQILGNNECFEPYTSNMYVRRVRAGEFIVVNPHLLDALVARGLWGPEMKNAIMGNGGSVRGLANVPEDLQELFKTVWEISPKVLLDMAADRGAFVDQSQSLNAFIADPDHKKLTAMHFYGWKRGLKTGMYYLRTKPATQAIQFTVDKGSSGGAGKKAAKKPAAVSTAAVGAAAAAPVAVFGEACTSCSG